MSIPNININVFSLGSVQGAFAFFFFFVLSAIVTIVNVRKRGTRR